MLDASGVRLAEAGLFERVGESLERVGEIVGVQLLDHVRVDRPARRLPAPRRELPREARLVVEDEAIGEESFKDGARVELVGHLGSEDRLLFARLTGVEPVPRDRAVALEAGVPVVGRVEEVVELGADQVVRGEVLRGGVARDDHTALDHEGRQCNGFDGYLWHGWSPRPLRGDFVPSASSLEWIRTPAALAYDGGSLGDVAQLELEHLLCKQGVVGSSPIVSTVRFPGADRDRGPSWIVAEVERVDRRRSRGGRSRIWTLKDSGRQRGRKGNDRAPGAPGATGGKEPDREGLARPGGRFAAQESF